MAEDPRVYIMHIRDSCQRIVEYTAAGRPERVMHSYEYLRLELIREMAERDVPQFIHRTISLRSYSGFDRQVMTLTCGAPQPHSSRDAAGPGTPHNLRKHKAHVSGHRRQPRGRVCCVRWHLPSGPSK